MTCETCWPRAAVVPAGVETGCGVGITGIAMGMGADRPPEISTLSWACAGSAARPMSSRRRSEEHTSELQSIMRILYAVFCLKKITQQLRQTIYNKLSKPLT